MKRGVIIVALMCAFMAMVAANVGGAADKKVIHVASPGSMFGRMHTVSNLFMKDQRHVEVDFKRSANVDAAFAALIDKSADIALTTRRITAAEEQLAKSKGLELTGRVIGHGGIVIITAARNSLNELTVEQVRKIFTGAHTNWNQLGGPDEPITVVRVGETYPGTVFFLQEDVFGGLPFATNAIVVPEFAGVIRKVAQTPGSIGFVRIRDAFESPIPYEMGFKVQKIKRDATTPAIMPSRKTVGDASYPIRRPYYVYYESKADTNIVKYVEFVQKKGWGQQNL
jgi:phosphate transport system substrate-binding protein